MDDNSNEEELLGVIEGLTNWMDILVSLIYDTDCNPDDEESFDEVLLCAILQAKQGQQIMKKYGFKDN